MLKRYLTEEEQRRLLKTVGSLKDIQAQRDDAWIRCLIHTGMRIGEFSRVTVGDALDALRTDYLFIPREHRKGKWADHSVRVTQPVREALTDLLAVRRALGYADRSDAPLVISRKGEAMTVRGYQQRFKGWALAAGLPEDASPHWLRHTRAMNIMAHTTSHDPRGIVQAALGHRSIASTGIYTGVSREELERSLDEVDGHGRMTVARQRRRYEERRAGA